VVCTEITLVEMNINMSLQHNQMRCRKLGISAWQWMDFLQGIVILGIVEDEVSMLMSHDHGLPFTVSSLEDLPAWKQYSTSNRRDATRIISRVH
jgi:hypothetical protein